jgi:UDP-N-acetylmuramoyl-tripeptide--D-alanyl-D-alanine ligase
VPLTLTRIDPAAHKVAVVEAGISEPGEMEILARMIEPDVAIITLVAPAHTEELGGIESVAKEKSELPAMTRPGGIALFPKSVAEFAAFRALRVGTRVVQRRDSVTPVAAVGSSVLFSRSRRHSVPRWTDLPRPSEWT